VRSPFKEFAAEALGISAIGFEAFIHNNAAPPALP
jgi:hypothetical protein